MKNVSEKPPRHKFNKNTEVYDMTSNFPKKVVIIDYEQLEKLLNIPSSLTKTHHEIIEYYPE